MYYTETTVCMQSAQLSTPQHLRQVVVLYSSLHHSRALYASVLVMYTLSVECYTRMLTVTSKKLTFRSLTYIQLQLH